MSDSVRPHRRQSTRLRCPWDSPGKNTGVGCIAFSNAWTWKVKVKSLSRVGLLVTPWTAAYQAPPSMEFSRQEYWSGSPVPSPEWTLGCCKSFSISLPLILPSKEDALAPFNYQVANNTVINENWEQIMVMMGKEFRTGLPISMQFLLCILSFLPFLF